MTKAIEESHDTAQNDERQPKPQPAHQERPDRLDGKSFQVNENSGSRARFFSFVSAAAAVRREAEQRKNSGQRLPCERKQCGKPRSRAVPNTATARVKSGPADRSRHRRAAVSLNIRPRKAATLGRSDQ